MFFIIYYHIKIKHDNLLINKLFKTSDEDHVKKSDLFLYIKKMLIIIFYNIYTSLRLINNVQDMIINIISDLNNKLLIQLKYQLE